MARAKKSSLDVDEPVIVQGEEEMVVETATEPVAEKAEKKSAVTKKETETSKTENKKRGVKVCVI